MTERMLAISACAVAAAILSAVLRKNVPEIAFVLALTAGLCILSRVSGGVQAITDLMRELSRLSGVTEVLLEPVFKTVVLAILTRLTTEICRGAGENGIAAFVELAGTVLALLAAVPLMRAVMELMTELLL